MDKTATVTVNFNGDMTEGSHNDNNSGCSGCQAGPPQQARSILDVCDLREPATQERTKTLGKKLVRKLDCCEGDAGVTDSGFSTEKAVIAAAFRTNG